MNENGMQNQVDMGKAMLAVFAFVCQTLAVSVEVFLHGDFGERYLGIKSAAAFLLIPTVAAFWPGHDVSPLLLFLLTYVGACFFAYMGIAVRGERGATMHSRYNGRPRLMRFTGRLSEVTVKRYVEPLIVFVVAMCACTLNEPLGAYLLLASFGLFASVHVSFNATRMRAMDMNDAFIDQHHVAERFREMRGDRY